MQINGFLIVVIPVYFISLILAIIQIIMAISPRIRSEKKAITLKANDKPIHQITFFEGISKFQNSEEYKKSLDQVINTNEGITDIYIKQIYQVAKINKTKYACVTRAVWFVVIALASQLAIIAYIFTIRPAP